MIYVVILLFNHLININFYREIKDVVGGRSVFIGITDRSVEGKWRYLNGGDFPTSSEQVLFYWNSREPNNLYGAEHCAVTTVGLLGSGMNDTPCSSNEHGLCEIPINR